jgi:hypothetical protein
MEVAVFFAFLDLPVTDNEQEMVEVLVCLAIL